MNETTVVLLEYILDQELPGWRMSQLNTIYLELMESIEAQKLESGTPECADDEKRHEKREAV